MQLLDPRRHGALVASNLALAREEDALDAQLDLLVGLVDGGADDKEAVRGARASCARCIAGAHGDRGRGLLKDFEVVGDQCALVVGAGRELLSVPELAGGLGAAVLVLEVLALYGVALWVEKKVSKERAKKKSTETQRRRNKETERRTPSTPDATAELEGQVAVLFQQLRTDFADRHPLDADVLCHGIARRVLLLVDAGRPDRVRRGEGRDDRVAGGQIGGGRRRAEQAREDRRAYESHGVVCGV